MERRKSLDEILDWGNIRDLHLDGMNKAFSLGNPWYGKEKESDPYFYKYLKTGEIYRVLVEFKYNQEGYCTEIIETFNERVK